MGSSAAKSVALEATESGPVARAVGTPVSQSAFAGLPALVVTADGSLKFSTAQAAALIDADGLKPVVRQHIASTRANGCAQLVRIAFNEQSEAHRFDLTLVPSVNGDVLVIARESSFEANLITALTNSRELFRDLAACNVDFAFETDHTGAFSWVSPRGVLGYSATELHGAHPTTIFGEVAGVETFTASDRVEDIEIWLHAKDGKTHSLIINAIAVTGAQGARRATRGVARDVTALRTHERQAWRIKRRDDLAATIIEAMRAEIDPNRMLNVTAAALRKATKSDAVSIVGHKGGLSAEAGAAEITTTLKLQANAIYHGSYNGTITLLRHEGRDAFGDDERQLLAAVMPQLGVAIALGETLIERAAQSRVGEV
jgi:PAS domain S-box-containing protein